MKNKVALVCGASAGLGFAAAKSLAAEGAELFIVSRTAERIENAADKIAAEYSVRPRAIAADIGTDNGIAAIKSAVSDHAIDILVSNGGGPPSGQFVEHESQAWQDAARLVLDSAISLTRLVIDSMIERKSGRLIYITSVGVLQPVDE
ncbi:MAG: SDR family NAD(P)-dependent oxidoreductase, partial [candidate division Zixibacteria bacterium]